jgi:hypothetical protein
MNIVEYSPVYINRSLLRELSLDSGISLELRERYRNSDTTEKNYDIFLGIEEFTSIKKVLVTPEFSKGDIVYKVDMVFLIEGTYYGIQLKSSECGVRKHYRKYKNGIRTEKFSIPCPLTLIPERNKVFFDKLLESLGSCWNEKSLNFFKKIETLKQKGIVKVPSVIFSHYEIRLLSFIGLTVRDKEVSL